MKTNQIKSETNEKSLSSFKYSVMNIKKDDKIKITKKDNSILIGHVSRIHNAEEFRLTSERYDEYELTLSDIKNIGKVTY